MDEKKELQKLHGFFQTFVYVLVFLEIFIFIYSGKIHVEFINHISEKLQRLPIYQNIYYSKFSILVAICLVSIGSKSKKNIEINPSKSIFFPLIVGLLFFFGSIFSFKIPFSDLILAEPPTNFQELTFIILSIIGAVLINIALDNVSKLIKSGFGKDEWNVEGESFQQSTKKIETPFSINIPMLFYFRKKVHRGWINIVNPFRGTLLIGTPGSGKTFTIVLEYMRQLIKKGFTMCIYDFKYPDLAKVAYYHYLLSKQNGLNQDFKFNVINLDDVEHSKRINPLKKEYLKTLADASETAEAIVHSLQKSESSGGSDKFFTQSAVNFLASCIYFVSRHEEGKYSTFAHLLGFLNRTYEEIFRCLNSYPELESLLSPFRSALEKKAFDQLEGQIGTLKIFISRLNTKETAWVFSGNDFELKISDPKNPSILILSNSPETQDINGTCYSVVINRLTRLINSKGNIPTAIIADEAPTLYIHRVENLISTARSNKVAVLLGLQELPQLNQLQGKETASTITSVIGNVISGSVRNKETLEWLERLFGKRKQVGESLNIDRNRTTVSLNEKYDPVIPAGKIASLQTGEFVGILAQDNDQNFNGKYVPSNIHCKANLDMESIKTEESNYRNIPKVYDFKGNKDKILTDNFLKIRREVLEIIDQYKLKPIAS